MKKKIFYGIAVLAIAAIAVFNVNVNMSTNGDQSLLSLANVEALAQENDGGNDEFKCSLTKDECKIKVTADLLPKLKEKFNINVSIGITVDLTDFTKVYAAADPSKPRVRCGTDVLCNSLL